MSRRPLLVSLVTLVTLVSVVVTVPLTDCPSRFLCRKVCPFSAIIAKRCEICYPGVCSEDPTRGNRFPLKRVISFNEPPAAKSSVIDGSIDVDDEAPTTQSNAPEENIEEDDEDIHIEGSGASGDGDPEVADSGGEAIEDEGDISEEESSPREPDPEKTELQQAGSDETSPDQAPPGEKKPEHTELEAPEPSEPSVLKPEESESKPDEIEPEKPETKESKTKKVPKELEPEEAKAEDGNSEDVEPDKTEEKSVETKPVEESPPDDSKPSTSVESESQRPSGPPKPEVYLVEKRKENETEEPKRKREEKKPQPDDSEDADSPSASAVPFSRTGGGSGLACLHLGTYRPLHSTWFDTDRCNLYVCTTLGVQTTSLTGACLPPPDDMQNCRRYRPPGQCCFMYECEDPDPGEHSPQSCIDGDGVERPHNADWVDDPRHPCVRFFCADGVVVVLSDMRPLCPVPPSHGCTAYQPDNMCCNDFNCTDLPPPAACLDSQGVRRENGQIWYDNDVIPCRKFLCDNGTIQLLENIVDSCADAPGPGCTPVPVSGKCCPTYTNCSCLLDGVEYLSGAVFPDDPTFPCRRLSCQNGTIVTLDERECAPLNCSRTFRRPGQCCYECVGCIHNGVRREEGSFWYDDPRRPCVRFTCSDSDVIEVNRTECPQPPGPHCQPALRPGDCCETFDCSAATCTFGDQIYMERDVWVDNPANPCKWYTCTRTGVQQVNSTFCLPPVPDDCPREREPGQCCFTCQPAPPVQCYYQGQTYREGAVWSDDPDFPCRWFTCRRAGVQQVNSTYCPALVPRDCPRQREPGQCCFTCQQTDDDPTCMDNTGSSRLDGEVYYTDADRCLLAQCTGQRERLLVNRTRLCPPPPTHNCTVVGRFECCPQYLCHLMPISNCTDPTGRQRDNGEIYANDAEGCLIVQCEEGSERLLVDRSSLCPPPDDPARCVQTGVRDCCPVYDCSGPVNCVDGSGAQRAEGEMYYEDPDRCLLVQCTGGEEVTLVDRTERCDPPPDAPDCVVQDTVDCCPVYLCPFCSHNNKTYPIGSTWWDDPSRQCERYRCSARGRPELLSTELPCPEVRLGCTPVREEPACCHRKYNCMFDAQHNLIPMV